ncbi:MAG: hypothetical protein EBZ77_06850 [Chitinophagia bacterium]|nr:hypothetical protein [Chitinophagia bacterium]
MNKSVLLLPLLAMLMACHSTTNNLLTDTVYTGRVVNATCGNITIQVTGNRTFGENGWTDKSSSQQKVYDHVFRLGNPCDAGLSAVQNDTFHFQVINPKPQNCVSCAQLGYTPQTTCSIQLVP